MNYKNLTLFRFPPTIDLSSLEAALGECPLKPVGPQELASHGFVPPMGSDAQALLHRVGNVIWISCGSETRVLPPAVINRALDQKMKEIQEREGRTLGARARRQLKDDLVHEMLPKAFVQAGRTDALIDLDHCFIAIDSSSRKRAEAVVSMVRQALGSFPALPLNAELAPRSVLTAWLTGEPLPEGLALGDECELRDPGDRTAVVKCTNVDLRSDEVGKHVEAGMQATRLAITHGDSLSYVLGEDLIVRKLKLLDGALAKLDAGSAEDLRSELDARFALLSGEVRGLFAVIEPALRLSKAA